MRWLSPVVSLFLMGFSLLVLVISLRLGFGNLNSPGPGFMGSLAAVLLLSLSFITLIKESLKAIKEEERGIPISRGSLTKILILITALCCYAFILEPAGYLVSTFFLMFIMFYVFNPKRWAMQLLFAFIVTNATYLLFNKWLQVTLPAGIFRIGW